MKHQKLICTVLIQLIVVTIGSVSFAADISAITDSFWNSSLTWTPATIPGAGDNAFIGSGSATNATVTLTQDQSASNVFLGYGSGTAGTLGLGNSKLTIGGNLYLGYSGGATGTILRGSGYFTASGLSVDNSNLFIFGTLDTVSGLSLYNSATAVTTAATGNVTANAIVYSGSTLKLGANLSLTGGLDVRGSGAILDMGGHTATAVTVLLGWNDGQPISVQNRGTLLTTNLYVGNQTFDLIATDSISNLYLSSAMLTTAATGNVTANAIVYSGSTLTLGANLSLTGGLDVRG